MDHVLPALVVFGGLLAICLLGLTSASAASARLHGSAPRRDGSSTGNPGSAGSSEVRL